MNHARSRASGRAPHQRNERPGPLWEMTSDGLPICPKHNAAMNTLLTFGYIHFVGEQVVDGRGHTSTFGHLCRGRPGDDSPGWER
jgi:hypothetical protein